MKKSSKRQLSLATAVVLGLALCLVMPSAPAAAPPAPVWKWPDSLRFATANATSATYLLTGAWTAVHQKDTGVRWRLVAERNTPVFVKWTRQGQIDFFAIPTNTIAEMMEGVHWFATRDGGPFQLRLVWMCDVSTTSYFVRGDSDIKTIYDVKPGTRYALWAGSAPFANFLEVFCAYLDMSPEDLKVVPFGSYVASCRGVAEGKADVAIASTTASIVYELAAAPHGIRFLSINPEDKEGLKRLHEISPNLQFARSEIGVKEGHGVNMFMDPRFYYTPRETDPELTYHLAKWLHENYAAYKDLHSEAPRMSLEWVRKNLDEVYAPPVHEGTIRYLKEIGIWTAADDARQEYNVRLVTRYCEAYKDAIALADDKGIDVTAKNKKWIELWTNYKKKMGLPRFRVMSDEEIKAGLTKLK